MFYEGGSVGFVKPPTKTETRDIGNILILDLSPVPSAGKTMCSSIIPCHQSSTPNLGLFRSKLRVEMVKNQQTDSGRKTLSQHRHFYSYQYRGREFPTDRLSHESFTLDNGYRDRYLLRVPRPRVTSPTLVVRHYG